MKLIRAFPVLVVLLLCSMAHADGVSTVLDVSATTCTYCFGSPNPLSIDLQAQFTVKLVTGQFFNSGGAYLFTGTVDEVVAITGTLNGHPMTLISPPHGGDGSWLYPGSYALGTVYFMADGSVSWLENDVAYNRLEISQPSNGYGSDNLINWSAVQVPEPESFVLLAVGLIGLVFLKLFCR
jgi:PEP-CTERM motif-containing protein